MPQPPDGQAPPEDAVRTTPASADSEFADPAWTDRRVIGLGVTIGLAVLLVRLTGVFEGLFALAAVGLLLPALLPSPQRYADRVLLVMVGLLGWIPLLGWVPGLLTSADLAGIVAAISFGLAAAARMRARLRQPDRATISGRFDRALAHALDIGPILLAAILTRYWSGPMLAGDSARRLRALLGMGWDHSAHATLTWQILSSGSFSFIERQSARGIDWTSWNYPHGLHYSAAFASKLAAPITPTDPQGLLDIYIWALVGAVGLSVLLTTSAIVRLIQPSRTSIFIAGPGAMAMAILFGLGEDVITSGFSTYFLSLAAIVVMGSIVLRSTGVMAADLWITVGSLLVVMYNWYPLAVVAVPLALTIAAAYIKRFTWWQTVIAGAAITVASLAPAAFSLQTGAAAANAAGGITQVSRPGLVLAVVTLWVLTSVAMKCSLRRSMALALSCAAGVLFLIALVVYQLGSTGSVEYYAEKWAMAVFITTIGFVALIGTAIISGWLADRQTFSARRVVALSVLLAIGASQMAGYAGPRWGAIAGNDALFGLQLRARVVSLPGGPNDTIASDILTQAALYDGAEERPFTTLLVSTEPGESHPYIREAWFAAFTQTFDFERFLNALIVLQMHDSMAENQPATLDALLTAREAGPLTLLTTPAFAEQINELGNPDLTAEPVLTPAPPP